MAPGRAERARGRAGAAAPSHTWPPPPVAKVPSEPRWPLSLAPLGSPLTQALTGNREGAHAAGIPPGDPHRCPRGSYLGSALRAAALLTECRDLPRNEVAGGRGRKTPEVERSPRPASETPPGLALSSVPREPASPAARAMCASRSLSAGASAPRACPAASRERAMPRAARRGLRLLVLRTVESLVAPRVMDWVPPRSPVRWAPHSAGGPGIPSLRLVSTIPRVN